MNARSSRRRSNRSLRQSPTLWRDVAVVALCALGSAQAAWSGGPGAAPRPQATDPYCAVQNTGLPLTFLCNGVLLDGHPVAAGSTLCLLDLDQGGLAVGGTDSLGNYPKSVPTWQADPDHQLPGARCGDRIGMQLLDAASGDLCTEVLQITWTEGDSLYCGENYTVFSVAFASPPRGPCCDLGTGVCTLLSEESCNEAGYPHLFGGIGTPCQPNPCPARFCPVTETGQPIAFVCAGVFLNDAPAASGGVLCITDLDQSDLPVGSAILTGVYPAPVAAWQGDPGHDLPGAACGERIGYRLMDAVTGTVYSVPTEVSYEAGDGLFCGEPYTKFLVYFTSSTGACCAPDGSCTVTVHAVCVGHNIWHGGVPCDPQLCSVPVETITWGRIKARYSR